MSTAYIYNGYGQYEEREGVKGVTLHYAGVPFFLPYGKVTAIPDWTLREVDHDKTTPDGEGEGFLTYKTVPVPGKRIAEELLEVQVPFKNREKGIIEITGKATSEFMNVPAGYGEMGEPKTVEVREVKATPAEIDRAETIALNYKKAMISEYFQSKRERMSGGHGRLQPHGMIRVFMEELGIEDIDDVMKHQKSTGGLDPETLKVILEFAAKSGEVTAAAITEAVEKARRAGRAPAPGKPRTQGLSAYKETYEAAIAEGKSQEEARELAQATQ